MRLQELDEKDHLVFVLSEHEEGDTLLNRGTLLDRRPPTTLAQKGAREEADYCYEEL